jgi:hypothetical protein
MYNELMRKKESLDLKRDMDKEITPEEKMESMVELIRYFYDKYKSQGIVNDYFNTLYNYLRRTNRLVIGKQIIDDALKYGKEEAIKHKKEYFDDALKKEKVNIEGVEKRYARNYCVQRYFDEISIEEIVNLIKPEHFVN